MYYFIIIFVLLSLNIIVKIFSIYYIWFVYFAEEIVLFISVLIFWLTLICFSWIFFIIFIVCFFEWLDNEFHVDEPIFWNLYVALFGPMYNPPKKEGYIYRHMRLYFFFKKFWFTHMRKFERTGRYDWIIYNSLKYFYYNYFDKTKKNK